MRNALRSIVILGILIVLDAVVFVPMNATAQAKPNANKAACCIPGNPPTCGQTTADTCTSRHPGATFLGAGTSCAKNPCLSSTTTTTGAATTTTSSAAPTTTTSSAAPTTTTSSAAPTTTTSSAAPTPTPPRAAPSPTPPHHAPAPATRHPATS